MARAGTPAESHRISAGSLSMTVPGKIIRNAAVALLILILLLAVATIEAVKTKRFREWVKQKIVTATEQGTGGRVNIGSLTLDWKNLRAVITDFVIHGNEPASAPPLDRKSTRLNSSHVENS